MLSFKCDLCKKEVREEDLKELSVKDRVTGEPVISPIEMCVWCKEDLVKILNNLEG